MPSKPLGPADIFRCKKCGDCCKGYGGTYVGEKEIKAIAKFLKIESRRLVDQYCRVSGSRLVLAQAENQYCVFWDGTCAIHPVKPHMCKSWPFIPGVLIDIKNWQVMAGSCPGMRIDVPDEVIKDCVARRLSGSQSE